MLVVVAFESMFGCTRVIAEAVAEGVLAGPDPPQLECRPASRLERALVARCDLLVVGGPTHHRTLATPGSVVAGRQLQRRAGPDVAFGPVPPAGPEPDVDLRGWLRRMPRPLSAGRAAVFDTRLPGRSAGGAAYAIAHRLRRHGYHLVEPVEGFLVDGFLGPLHPGERERAVAWGDVLRRALRAGVP